MEELRRLRQEIEQTDREMARLFEKRMHQVAAIAAEKQRQGLAIRDEARERELLQRNKNEIQAPALRRWYTEFFIEVLALSRRYQRSLGTEAEGAPT